MRSISFLPLTLLLFGCDIRRPLGDDLQVRLVAPLAGAGTGSVHAAAAGQPTLRWKSSPQAQTYQLQVDDSCDAAATCDFPSPEIDETALVMTSFVPASPLPASSTAPFNRPYYWRVRACSGASCGEWSQTRHFVVGQDLALNRDINGDGYPDFLVGAPESLSGNGQAFLYMGGPRLPSAANKVISSAITLDGLGVAVAMAGDVNGDGYGDFLVRSVGNSENVGTQVGRVLLFFGGPTLSDRPDIVFEGGAPDDENGSMAGCGDLNGDGYDDIAFGAVDIDADHHAIEPSRVEIHFGGPAMASSPPLVLYGDSQPIVTDPVFGASILADFFGSSVSAAGDVNGDGYPDLIVGAHQGVPGGKGRIYYGGPGMDATPDVVLEYPTAQTAGGLYGFSVTGLGDINGDGFADVAVGAPGADAFPPPIGRVYIYFGGLEPHTTPDIVLEGSHGGEWFGTMVAPLGDVDHDGYPDLAVMARGVESMPGDTELSMVPGSVLLYSLGQNGGQSPIANVPAGTTFSASGKAFAFNTSLAVLDVDGDAEPEILVGQWDDRYSQVFGQVAIYNSRNNYVTPVRRLSGAKKGGDWFARAISR